MPDLDKAMDLFKNPSFLTAGLLFVLIQAGTYTYNNYQMAHSLESSTTRIERAIEKLGCGALISYRDGGKR